MMKKLVTIIAAALLTMGLAANAMASFNDGDLIRVVYNHGGSVEVATDLGSISSIQSGGSLSTSAFSLSQISGATTMGDLYVAYFAKQYLGSGNINNAWVGVDSASSAPVTGNRKFNYLNNAASP